MSLAIFHPHFVIRIFSSAFYHPHFSIRVLSSATRHPLPSGPHFTETPIELQLERKVYDGCQSISRRNVFRRLISGSIPATWMIEPGKQTTTPQGKPCFILSKLQYCASREVFFFVEVSYMLKGNSRLIFTIFYIDLNIG